MLTRHFMLTVIFKYSYIAGRNQQPTCRYTVGELLTNYPMRG